jgi:hypothetical protein
MSESSDIARLIENTTSSAVKSAPSWKVTPWRRLNTQTFGSSGLGAQSVASAG